jgi:hypothetical protein
VSHRVWLLLALLAGVLADAGDVGGPQAGVIASIDQQSDDAFDDCSTTLQDDDDGDDVVLTQGLAPERLAALSHTTSNLPEPPADPLEDALFRPPRA